MGLTFRMVRPQQEGHLAARLGRGAMQDEITQQRL